MPRIMRGRTARAARMASRRGLSPRRNAYERERHGVELGEREPLEARRALQGGDPLRHELVLALGCEEGALVGEDVPLEVRGQRVIGALVRRDVLVEEIAALGQLLL